jgi:tight adherence protein B
MLMTVAMASGLAARVPLVVLAAIALAVYQPVIALVAVAAVVVLERSRRRQGDDEGAFLQAVASEMRSGAAVRVAIADAASRVPSLPLARTARLARAGRPLDEIADSIRSHLPRSGLLTAAAIRIAGVTGGRIADTFDELALIAAEDMEMRGETRAATAQARISAWIVGGIPVAYTAYAIVSGRLAALISIGATGVGVLCVGGALLVSGVLGVVAIARKAER